MDCPLECTCGCNRGGHRFVAHPRQLEYIRAILDGRYRHALYGGAAGGGKTYVLCAVIALLALYYPGSRWAIVRADLPRLKRTVIPTWRRVVSPDFFGDVHRTEWTVTAHNGSEILFLPASEDTDPDFQRLRSLELNGAACEECNELSEGYVDVLNSRLGRWPIEDGSIPTPLTLYSCNPNQAWPKARFYDRWVNGTLPPHYFYLPARVTDNPHISPAYLEQLQDLPPRQRGVFFDGDWSNADEPDQLITNEWVDAGIHRTPTIPVGTRTIQRWLGVDVARYGDDETVRVERMHWHVCSLTARKGYDTAQTAQEVALRAAEAQIDGGRIRVDTVGLGAGVADTLFRHYKIKPIEFIAGAKPVGYHKYLKFKNLRSEQWWHLRELLQNGPLSIDPALMAAHPKLRADLTAPRYSMDSDRVIEVESKDSIKTRLGRSTDYGDALVQCCAHMGSVAERMAVLSNPQLIAAVAGRR